MHVTVFVAFSGAHGQTTHSSASQSTSSATPETTATTTIPTRAPDPSPLENPQTLPSATPKPRERLSDDDVDSDVQKATDIAAAALSFSLICLVYAGVITVLAARWYQNKHTSASLPQLEFESSRTDGVRKTTTAPLAVTHAHVPASAPLGVTGTPAHAQASQQSRSAEEIGMDFPQEDYETMGRHTCLVTSPPSPEDIIYDDCS